MKRSTRMMLMKDSDKRRDGRDYPEGEARYDMPIRSGGIRYGYDDGPRAGNAPEDRFRDRRGREHYDDGRYAPQNYSGDDRYRPSGDGQYNPYDGDGYPAYPVGIGMQRGEDSAPHGSWYPHYPGPYNPPYYNGEREIGVDARPVKMHKIGFSVDGEMERIPSEFHQNYRSTMPNMPTNEMQHRRGEYMAGYGSGNEIQPMDKATAEHWASKMENEDGSTGPHWTMEQTKQVQAQKGIDCDPVHFWVAMNMVYSDYMKVAKKLSVNNADFYASMAEAFLDDKDAQPDKLERYYQFVVKH